MASTDEPPCNELAAVDLAKALVDSYRPGQFNNPDVFLTGAAANFAQFPLTIGRQVVDPVRGIPAKLKFPPTIAEVREALDEALTKRRAINHRARWMIRERTRREDEERRQAEIAAIPSERRAEMAEFARNAFRPKPMPQHDSEQQKQAHGEAA